MTKIRIGTRTSKLALTQTEIVKELLKQINIETEIIPIKTKGDLILDTPLEKLGGKGVFTKELEDALLRGEIDLAVHSAKDLPMDIPDGLKISAVGSREDVTDVFVTCTGCLLKDMPSGSKIGTGSLRRELQIKNINSEIEVLSIRGNVPTRLEKLKKGLYDGIILAQAGLNRLQIDETEEFYFEKLPLNQVLPAAGQGILAIEIREDFPNHILEKLSDETLNHILTIERAFLKEMDGSCNAPAAVLCVEEENTYHIDAKYWSQDEKGVYQLYTESTTARSAMTDTIGLVVAQRIKEQNKKGLVVLAGTGPGNIGLVTLDVIKYVKKADVLVYDHLIPIGLLEYARADAKLYYCGKKASDHYLKQDEIERLLIAEAQKGLLVVRLKGGDPFVFGRGAEEALSLKKAGIPYKITAGVSSSYSVPEYAGIPVTHRTIASSFHVITGHEGEHKKSQTIHYKSLAQLEGTLVFLMGLSQIDKIAEKLISEGKSKETAAAVISKGTTAKQKKVIGSLETIGELVKIHQMKTPAIFVVGDVCTLSDDISWFEENIFGDDKVLLTGTKGFNERLQKSLTENGIEAAPLSLLQIQPIMNEHVLQAFSSFDQYNWLVFTSTNGVELFFKQMQQLNIDYRKISHMKFAVVGKGTDKALRAHGFTPDLIPEKYTTASLAEALLNKLTKEDSVLIMRARKGAKELYESLVKNQIAVEDVALYDVSIDLRKEQELHRQVEEAMYVVFASPSAINAFLQMYGVTEKRVICIGPVTAEYAVKKGIHVHGIAKEYDIDGIVETIKDDMRYDRTR